EKCDNDISNNSSRTDRGYRTATAGQTTDFTTKQQAQTGGGNKEGDTDFVAEEIRKDHMEINLEEIAPWLMHLD
ncbi:Hypothetical predicted protein, partial [Pelobates cultripes]